MAPAVRVGALLGLSPVGSAFLISVAGYGLAAILVELLLRPDPLAIARRSARARDARNGRPRPRASARARSWPTPRVRIAFGSLMVGSARDDRHHLHVAGLPARPGHTGAAPSALAVAMHLGGMYVASPLSGWLSDRFGAAHDDRASAASC